MGSAGCWGRGDFYNNIDGRFFVFLFLGWQAFSGKRSEIYWPTSPYFLFWYFFWGWYALSIFWSIERIYSFRYLFYLLLGVSIVFLMTSYVVTRERYLRVFSALQSVFILAILIALLEAFTSFRLPTSPYSEYADFFGRKATDFSEFGSETQALIRAAPTSFWGNPNNLSVVVVSLLPFFLFARSWVWRVVGGGAIFIIILMAGSRGAFIAFVVGGGVYLALRGMVFFWVRRC